MDELLTPEVIAGISGGVVVVLSTLAVKGLGLIRDFIKGTPTKLDDKIYNAFVKAVKDAGPLPPFDGTVEREAPGTGEPGKEVEGNTITRTPFAVTAAALLLALVTTSACSIPRAVDGMGGGLRMGAPVEDPDAEAERVSAQQKIGDELFGEVTSDAARKARMHLVIASVFYLQADRVTRFDSMDARSVLGNFQQLRGVLARVSTLKDDVFDELRLREANLELAGIILDSGLARAKRLPGVVFSAGVTGLIQRGRVAGRQAIQIDALIFSIRDAVASMNADATSIEGMHAAAAALMDESEARVRALLGAPALVSPSPAAAG